MKKVANKKMIRMLSYRTIKEKKWKNLIAVLAIGLTAVLFTAVFTVGSSMISSIEESTMRQVGTRAHGGYKYVTMEEYEAVKATGGYADISYDIYAGFGVNDALGEIQTEVRYFEDKMARWCYCYPEKGKMPEEINECVASSKVLEALGVPMELGAKVPLIISSHDREGNEKIIEEEFVLCGYYQSNDASHAQSFAVSKKWLEENIELIPQNYTARMVESGAYTVEGYLQVDVWFDSSFDIESQMRDLTRLAGLSEDEIKESVNWAYMASNVDGVSIALIIIIMGIIMLSGYLIIYNIFYINVTTDIRYYGLLKTIGTTGRQIRTMVYQQALFLSAIGIPFGLSAGWFVGKGILPAVYKSLDTGGVENVSLNGFIFAGSALFSLIVVYLSCIRPCRLAAKVSPIEAVRYVENVSGKKKEKKTAKVSAAYLAAANMGRNKKKAAIVIASLSLSLVLLNATYCMIKGFSFEEYVQDYLTADAQITHNSIINMSASYKDTEAVPKELSEALEDIEGVEEIQTIWYKSGCLTLPGPIFERFQNYYESEEIRNKYPYAEEQLKGFLETKVVYAENYCLEEDEMSLITIKEGEFDEDKFKQGGYVLLLEDVDSRNWLSIGDKITVGGYENERTGPQPQKELEIMALASLANSAGTRSRFLFGAGLVLCEQDFEELYDVKGSLHTCLTIEEGREEEVLSSVTEQIEAYPGLALVTKESLKKEFANELKLFSTVGNLLGAVLALIGVLNFINAMITGILARKQEFAMMQAVGMTGKQLEAMLIMEGIWYGVWTLVIAATLGNVVSYGLLYLIGNMMRSFKWSFHILPLAVSVPVIAFISAVLPVICYHTLCRKSIIERLRLTEV